jgi:hypothetical protein
MTRAQALSDAIHAKLFPQTSRYTRQEESRRIIAELVAKHYPEQAGDAGKLLDIIDCGTNALIDSINCSGNDAVTNKHWVRKMRREAGLDETHSLPNPQSDPSHVAD